MAVPPNRMEAFRAARAAEAQPDPSTSILDLDPEAFAAALAELGLPPEERAFVEQQYFAHNRALPMTPRPEGKRVGMVAPIAFPEGMTGSEALMSGDFEFTAPEFLRGIYEAPAEAANVAGATVQGVPVTEQQMQEAAQGAAEVFTGIGPARALVRGQALDPNVVSMSGARGMGDNGGPAMPPQRYINPNTGLYSPSFEAARALPQEVGTPQQMRSMLLKGGAKEEELVYSGFDEWLRGRDRVTKQEIEDVLGASAAGYVRPGETTYDRVLGQTVDRRAGNMPYVRVSEQANAGVTGVTGTSLGDAQDAIYEQILEGYNAQRRERLLTGLQERGYNFPQLRDEATFRDFAGRMRQQWENYDLRSGGPRVPSSVANNILRVEGLLNRGESFDSPEVQRIIRSGIEYNTDGMVRPDGSMTYTYDAIEDEFPDEVPALELSRGNMPEEVRDDATRAYRMSPEEAADYLGIDVEDILNTFDPGRSTYGSYVVPGMRNYSENQYMYDDTGRGVLSGIESLGVSPFSQSHFNAGRKPLMFFTLTGELNTPEGPAYNLAQIQSDIGQAYNEEPGRFFVPGSTPERLDFPKPEKRLLENYVEMGKRYEELLSDISMREVQFYDRYLDEETGTLRKDDPTYADAAREIQNLRRDREDLRDELSAFESKNTPLFQRLEDHYGKPLTYSSTNRYSLDFTVAPFEEALSGNAPAPRYAPGKKVASLPFATSTNRWLDAAFKNELINAAKSGAEWITIPKGDDVQSYTGGDIVGQRKFYGGPDDKGIAPMRLKNLAKKLIPFETEFKDMEAKGFGPNPPTYNVFGMRLTPEIRKFLLEEGLPSFAKGGPVIGSSLDVDVFAFQ